jgi:hypothetical protein
MSTNFIVVWVILVLMAYMLRLYCVSAIQRQSPKLYELLGKPAYISRYSWGFLHKASKHPEFQELNVRTRGVVEVARALDVIITILSTLIVFIVLKVTFFGH